MNTTLKSDIEPLLSATGLTLSYEDHVVSRDLQVEVAEGSFTVVIGPNACGKSTLLRTLSRLHKPDAGEVKHRGRPIGEMKGKELARELAFLPQRPIAPDAITVSDLVARGRYPHQSLLRQWSSQDDDAVNAAMVSTGVSELADRSVEELSGGQRQRVWVAMVLAQEAGLMLLDEPTTFLDIAHQVEVLDLCADLNQNQGRTIVAVLHDINQACRYADHLVVMKEGRVLATGSPTKVVDEALITEAFGLSCLVIADPESGTPLIIPRRSRT